MTEFTLKLSKPLKTFQGEVLEITLREPNGGDLLDLGVPVSVERTMAGNRSMNDTYAVTLKVTRNMAVCRSYLARLSGIELPLLGAMSAKDMMKAIDWLCDVALGESETGKNPIQAPSP